MTPLPNEPDAFSEGVDISSTQDGGLIKVVKRASDESQGHPSTGDSVFVHYVGTLLDGTQFDSSRDRGELFEFKLGEGMVIKGWDQGVATMCKGEVALLKCSPDFAYGARGSPPTIPEDATLVFEVELFSWRGADLTDQSDGGILKSIITKGKGEKKPLDGDTVEVGLEGKFDGRVFDARTANFVVGEGDENGVFESLETGIKHMNLHEKAVITFQPKYAFGDLGNEQFKIPPNAEVTYQVELTQLDRGKESWEMDEEEKLSTAESCKLKGSHYFKLGKIPMAIKQYKRVSDYLDNLEDYKEEQRQKANAILLAAHLNLSMCYLKLNQSYECIQSADAALALDNSSVKAHFRRGEALMLQKDWESAKKDFDFVLSLEPENKAARNKIAVCLHKVKEQKLKEKNTYQHIFKTMWKEQEEEEKKRKKEKKVKKEEDEEEDPAMHDIQGQVEAMDIPVLSEN